MLSIVDANNNIVGSYTYDTWGKVLSATGSMSTVLTQSVTEVTTMIPKAVCIICKVGITIRRPDGLSMRMIRIILGTMETSSVTTYMHIAKMMQSIHRIRLDMFA